MNPKIGIRAVAVEPGEIEPSLGELAQICGTTERAIHRSLGGRKMRMTRCPPVLLAIAAATRCLKNDNCAASELSAIIWLGDQVSGLRLQHEIGASHAYLICIAGDCSEPLTALSIAKDHIESPEHRVLIASGECFARRHTDTIPTEQNFRNLLGDSGSALLVGGDPKLEILGFGFASRGAEWEYLDKIDSVMKEGAPAENIPFYAQVFRESLPVAQMAIERGLHSCGLSLSEIDLLCFSSIRLQPLLLPLLRLLKLPPNRLRAHQAFVHMGQADLALDCEAILADPPISAGRSVMVMASGTGVFRCAVLRVC